MKMNNKPSNNFTNPRVKINKALDVFSDKILFPEKVEEANRTLKKTILPKIKGH